MFTESSETENVFNSETPTDIPSSENSGTDDADVVLSNIMKTRGKNDPNEGLRERRRTRRGYGMNSILIIFIIGYLYIIPKVPDPASSNHHTRGSLPKRRREDWC